MDPNELDKQISGLEQKLTNLETRAQNMKLDVLFTSVSAGIKQFSDQIKKAEDNTSSLSNEFDTFSNLVNKSLALLSGFKIFDNLSIQGGAAVNTMSKQFDLLANRLGSVGAAAKMLGGNIGRAFMEGSELGVRKLLDQAAQAEKLEGAYLNLAASTGQLGAVYDKAGKDLSKLKDLTAEFDTHLADTAKLTGLNTGEVAAYLDKARNIPGIMDQFITGTGGATDKMDSLTAAFKLAKGASVDVNVAFDVMEKAYEDLSNPQGKVIDNTEKGAKMFALMSEASQKLGLRFDDTKGFMNFVADAFKNVGDNTQAATNILARFSGALQNTGLTAKASVDVVKGMIEAVKGLEMGTKALISLRSGGPGGLQGAFRVENLIRQGKSDEVAKMLETSFKQQVGGRIYTQEEAANSPQAAAQFMRQRELLKSGAFGGLAKTDDTATRLLEAMAKGPASTAGEVKNAMGALKDTVEKGEAVNSRQYTELNRINTTLDRGLIIQEQQLMLQARSLIGTNNPGSEYAQKLLADMNNTQEKAVANLMKGGEPTAFKERETKSFEQSFLEENRKTISGLSKTLDVKDQIGSGLKGIVGNATSELGKITGAVGGQYQKIANEKRIAEEQLKSLEAQHRGDQLTEKTVPETKPIVNNITNNSTKVESPKTNNQEVINRALKQNTPVPPQAVSQIPKTPERPANLNAMVPAMMERSNANRINFEQRMQNAAQHVVRQAPPTLAAQIPKPQEMPKQEINMSPLEVKIKVETEDGLKVQTTTNRPPNTTIETINSTVARGGIQETIR